MFTTSAVLALLSKVPAVVAALPEFKAVFDQIVATFKNPGEQEQLRASYAEAIAKSDADFARVDAKLGEAEQR